MVRRDTKKKWQDEHSVASMRVFLFSGALNNVYM
jgi:hypothetical protein